MAKLGRGANIGTDVLLKICKALDCELEDIMEIEWEKTIGGNFNGKIDRT